MSEANAPQQRVDQAAGTIEALTKQIQQLKAQRDAVILAHYYVPPEVQDVADYVGDSFALAKLAVDLPQQTIVLCGVEFMGESAKLLNPEKRVLLPESGADCPMAHMVRKADIDRVRAEHDDLAVVCYVNSTAEAKTWSDVCVTSSNAVKICRALPQRNILFIPDMNLGRYVAEQLPVDGDVTRAVALVQDDVLFRQLLGHVAAQVHVRDEQGLLPASRHHQPAAGHRS